MDQWKRTIYLVKEDHNGSQQSHYGLSKPLWAYKASMGENKPLMGTKKPLMGITSHLWANDQLWVSKFNKTSYGQMTNYGSWTKDHFGSKKMITMDHEKCLYGHKRIKNTRRNPNLISRKEKENRKFVVRRSRRIIE